MRELAAQFLTLAERQGTTVSLMLGHRLTGVSLIYTGDIAEGRAHLDRAIGLYDPIEHRGLAIRFGRLDARVVALSYRSLALWLLGYPEAARADTEHALKDAREIDEAATLMNALFNTTLTQICRGDYALAAAQSDEVVALADEKEAPLWKAVGMLSQGYLLALTGKPSNAVQMLVSAVTALRSTGSTLLMPLSLSYLAKAYAELDRFGDARHCIGEAISAAKSTKEKWCEADIHRIAGEIALMSPELDAAKVEPHFERALAISREQQAKSWELRAAMSMARLWRDQGKSAAARALLAPVYGWFTEGFDTLDLKEARTLLDQLT
jgi:predicted ATPase